MTNDHRLDDSSGTAVRALDLLEDCVVAYDRDGRHLYVNRTAQAVIAPEGGSLLGKSHRELGFSPEQCDLWETAIREVWDRLEPKDVVFEFPVEGRRRLLDLRLRPEPGPDGRCASVVGHARDVTEERAVEETMRFLVESGWPASGEPFFEALARFLARILAVDYVCIDRLEEERKSARTLAVFDRGRILPNVSYTLADTPCGSLVGLDVCCFPERVYELFPKDEVLAEMRAESYVGTTLRDSRGEPVGLVACIGSKRLEDRELAERILRLVGVRAAGELERLLSAEELSRALEEKSTLHRELQHRVKNSMGMILSIIQVERLERPGGDSAAVLEELERRVAVISELYARIYAEGSSEIELAAYLEAVCASHEAALSGARTGGPQVIRSFRPLVVGAKPASSLGLVLNELLTNAFKYGDLKDGRGLRIEVSLEVEGGLVLLRVADSGPGLADPLLVEDSPGFGLRLVGMLAADLGGRVALESGPGARFLVELPLSRLAASDRSGTYG